MKNIAIIIVAAGQGSRARSNSMNSQKGIPKQYQSIGGASSIRRSIDVFAKIVPLDSIQCVIGQGQSDYFQDATKNLTGLRPPVTGGANRQSSVRNGLVALQDDVLDIVLVHDAARPFVTGAIIRAVIEGLETSDAVIPALASTATIKLSGDGVEVERTLDRSALFEAQTPQGFNFAKIQEAHARAQKSDLEFTDDASIAEWAKIPVKMVAGDARNFKVTTAQDFRLAEFHLKENTVFETRTGSGLDIHRFVDGDHVRLAEVNIPNSKRLEGHSDADAALHVLTDALLGAMAAGDIGQHFPPSEPKWKGEPSRTFLSFAANLVKERGGRIVNLDLTLMCEMPKIGPHAKAMRQNIADICQIDVSRVSVKATTAEKMGFVGRGEGLLANGIATIELPRNPQD